MKKILILGASRYYANSIKAARKAGYFVIATDKNSVAEGLQFANEGIVCNITDKEAILNLSLRHKIHGIIPVNDYGVPTAAYVAEKMGLLGISQYTAILATNKEQMRETWAKEGVPCPRFAVAESKADFRAAIKKVGLPCVFKPAHGIGGGSRGVIVVREETEIDQAIQFTQGFYDDPTTLVESFIAAIMEHSAEVIIVKGVPYVLAISDKIKTPLPYRVDRNVLYPTFHEGKSLEALKQCIVKAVQALGINYGAAHVELATTKDGYVLFETWSPLWGWRYTGTYYTLCHRSARVC